MLKFSKEIYNKQALLKAAYSFTDRAYIHLDLDDDYYFVDIKPKNEEFKVDYENFKNEILAQMVRLHVSERTKNIRELILARALSSTLIQENKQSKDVTYSEEFDINDILKDWFEDNE